MDAIHQPLAHEDGNTVYFSEIPNTYTKATVVSIPVNNESDPYTVQTDNTGNIHEIMATKLLDHDPTATATDPKPTPSNGTFPLLPWINDESKATLWLPGIMTAPKQGHLKYTDDTDSWAFSPGKHDKHEHIPLPRFKEIAQSMVTNKKLFQG